MGYFKTAAMKIIKSLIIAQLFAFSAQCLATEGYLPEPTQDTNAVFRLFRTKNIFTLIKLDTRTGSLSTIEWGKSARDVPLVGNQILLVKLEDGKKIGENNYSFPSGRFTLIPTENIWTFILLDQVDGRTWYVQWGEPSFIQPIEK